MEAAAVRAPLFRGAPQRTASTPEQHRRHTNTADTPSSVSSSRRRRMSLKRKRPAPVHPGASLSVPKLPGPKPFLQATKVAAAAAAPAPLHEVTNDTTPEPPSPQPKPRPKPRRAPKTPKTVPPPSQAGDSSKRCASPAHSTGGSGGESSGDEDLQSPLLFGQDKTPRTASRPAWPFRLSSPIRRSPPPPSRPALPTTDSAPEADDAQDTVVAKGAPSSQHPARPSLPKTHDVMAFSDDSDVGDGAPPEAGGSPRSSCGVRCPSCNRAFPPSQIDAHANQCLDDATKGAVQSCHLCHKDISAYTPAQQERHINACCDLIEAQQAAATEVGADRTEAPPKDRPVRGKHLTCVVCRKRLRGLEHARLAHVKRCAKEHNISAGELISLLRRRSEQPDLFDIVPTAPAASTDTDDFHNLPARKKAKGKQSADPRTSKRARVADMDEDMQLAVALSTSLVHSKGKKHNPGAKKPKRLSKHEQRLRQPVPKLMLRTDAERQKILDGRLNQISWYCASPLYEEARRPAVKGSQGSSCDRGAAAASDGLWQAARGLAAADSARYTVACLDDEGHALQLLADMFAEDEADGPPCTAPQADGLLTQSIPTVSLASSTPGLPAGFAWTRASAGAFADVCFGVGGTLFWAHRLVLFALLPQASPLVCQAASCRAAGSCRVEVSHVEEHIFSCVLDFLYSGRATCSQPDLASLRLAASVFLVTGLIAACDEARGPPPPDVEAGSGQGWFTPVTAPVVQHHPVEPTPTSAPATVAGGSPTTTPLPTPTAASARTASPRGHGASPGGSGTSPAPPLPPAAVCVVEEPATAAPEAVLPDDHAVAVVDGTAESAAYDPDGLEMEFEFSYGAAVEGGEDLNAMDLSFSPQAPSAADFEASQEMDIGAQATQPPPAQPASTPTAAAQEEPSGVPDATASDDESDDDDLVAFYPHKKQETHPPPAPDHGDGDGDVAVATKAPLPAGPPSPAASSPSLAGTQQVSTPEAKKRLASYGIKVRGVPKAELFRSLGDIERRVLEQSQASQAPEAAAAKAAAGRAAHPGPAADDGKAAVFELSEDELETGDEGLDGDGGAVFDIDLTLGGEAGGSGDDSGDDSAAVSGDDGAADSSVDVAAKMLNFLKSGAGGFYADALVFKPVQVDALQSAMKADGIVVTQPQLRTFLSDKSIQFSKPTEERTAGTRKKATRPRHRNKRRHHRKE